MIAGVEALSNHQTPPGRLKIIKGIRNTTIIDDTYNSSPVAVEEALASLGQISTKGKRIVVLGDMMELGQYSVAQHEKTGHMVAEVADYLVTVGIRSRSIAEGALESGMPESRIRQYEDARLAGKELEELLGEDDIVLVKGSQSIRAERAVEEIMMHSEHASELLVRQDPMWQNI